MQTKGTVHKALRYILRYYFLTKFCDLPGVFDEREDRLFDFCGERVPMVVDSLQIGGDF